MNENEKNQLADRVMKALNERQVEKTLKKKYLDEGMDMRTATLLSVLVASGKIPEEEIPKLKEFI